MSKQARNIYYIVVGALVLIILGIIFGKENLKDIQTFNKSIGVNLGLILMYLMLGISTIGALALAIKGLVNYPKNAIRSIIGVGSILLLFIIGYLLDGGVIKVGWDKFGILSNGVSKAVGGSLIMMYLMILLAIIVAIGGPFLHLLRKK